MVHKNGHAHMALYTHTHTNPDKNHRHQEIAGNFFANQIGDSHYIAKYNGDQNRECHSQKGDYVNRYFHFIQISIKYFDKLYYFVAFLPPGKDELPPLLGDAISKTSGKGGVSRKNRYF